MSRRSLTCGWWVATRLPIGPELRCRACRARRARRLEGRENGISARVRTSSEEGCRRHRASCGPTRRFWTGSRDFCFSRRQRAEVGASDSAFLRDGSPPKRGCATRAAPDVAARVMPKLTGLARATGSAADRARRCARSLVGHASERLRQEG